MVGRTGSPGSTNAASAAAVVGTGAYDVTRMREEEFERLTVYIVPDVPCERGTPNRAEKTLPRSLALRPSVVLSTPNTPVRIGVFYSDLSKLKRLTASRKISKLYEH